VRVALGRFGRNVLGALLCATLVGLAGGSAAASAQRLERVGAGDPEIDRRIDALIASGAYTVLTESRTIARGDTIPTTLVVAAATVRVEGVILGDLIVIDANVFVRPTGVVHGGTLNVIGGYYPSELAAISGDVLSAPNAPYRVEYDGDVIRLVGLVRRPTFELEGFRGLLVPSYDRVDGLTVSGAGALLLPAAAGFEPRLRARVDYRTARRAVTGNVEIVAERDELRLAAGVERTTLTNELWIHPRWKNSLTFFFAGNDYFDHYAADLAYAEARLPVLRGGVVPVELTLRLQAEQAGSLEARNVWSVFGRGERRPNRPVNEGRINSAIASATAAYAGERLIAGAAVLVEGGRGNLTLDSTPAAELGTFGRYQFGLDVAMAGLRHHTLQIDANFRGPLPGTDDLPRQRWSHVGGAHTLYTYPIATFQGDRLVHVHTSYSVPFRDFRLPLVGPPTIEAIHVAAMAWSRTTPRDLEQNVGAGIRAGFFYVRYMVNPADTGQSDLSVGLTLPARARPWARN
jgi:hypothetical protein